jgi:hypothetical protein
MSHDHGVLIAQFRETLTQQRYSPVVVHNYCRNADHFLRYLAERGIDVEAATPAKPPIPVTTGSVDSHPSPSASFCESFRETIELGLRQGRNAMGIWQDLVSQAGFQGGYQTVKRVVRKLRGSHTPEAYAVIVTGPG